MRVGFTGTQQGMTEAQREVVRGFLLQAIQQDLRSEFHHGDCIGADADAWLIAEELGFTTVCHPPDNPRKRAHTHNAESWVPKPYLIRNHDIVDATETLLACPKSHEEELRSGTWATVRYARKIGRKVVIVGPDGKAAL